ncbi:MAG: hypothetical protein ACREDM_10925 [Methylocella sp.]
MSNKGDAMEAGGRLLPMMAAVERSYGLAWQRAAALKMPLIALAALFAIDFLLRPAVRPGHMPSGGGVALYFLISIAFGIATTGFIVGTHRMVLKSEHRGGLGYFRFDGATWKYFGYTIVFGITVAIAFAIVGAVAAAISVAGAILLAPLAIAAIFIALRLWIFLPAVAIGGPGSLASAWAATRGNTLRLFTGALLVGLPAEIASVILNAIFVKSGFIGKLIGAILVGPIEAALVLLLTIFISLAYDCLVRGGGPGVDAAASAAPQA